MGVAGVVWVPGAANLGYTSADYAAELQTYARSLPATYGQDKVAFYFAQPAATLVPGITAPQLENGKFVTFEVWPKSLKTIAAELAKMAQ